VNYDAYWKYEMAGIAFLPWEEWIARGLHRLQRKRSLAMSANWPQAEGTVHGVNWDGSHPREEVVYSYSTERGFYSGYFWRWFDSSDVREVRVGDAITLRYDPEEHDRSVFLSFG
jgi:Protein of unknown function (DUF3592)